MSHNHNVIENQIFEHYRDRAKAINDAIELLIEHKYTVIDHNGKWITKEI